MRIALLSRYLPSNSKMGVGYQAHGLANQLVRRGHQVTIFSESPKPKDALYECVSFGVNGVLKSLKASWKMRSMIAWTEYDVLHAHGDDWFLWNSAVPPHVRTVHGSCLSEAWHISGFKGKTLMLWYTGLETLSCLVADRVIGVSRNTCKSYPWIKEVIPNGVDLTRFLPGEKATDPTILFVGTYENRKRGKWLMEIFQQKIRPEVPNARLQMVCDAPSEPGVEVLGRVDSDLLSELYRKAWVFCLPSTYEGFGVPYIEAMASGTAVVASPNPGAVEILDCGKYGVLSKDTSLADEVKCLLTNHERRETFEKLGVRRAQFFSWDVVVKHYLKVYEEVIESKPTRLKLDN